MLPEMDDQGIDLIRKMFTFEPNSRITAADSLLHEYFHGMVEL